MVFMNNNKIILPQETTTQMQILVIKVALLKQDQHNR